MMNMNPTLFNSVDKSEKVTAVDTLVSHSSPSQEFFLMVLLSVLMAALGLLMDSAAVVIGSMLLAPILYPILSLSLGIIMADTKLINYSATTLFQAILFGICASALATLLTPPIEGGFSQEILDRTAPTILHLGIAIVAGFAASIAMVKKDLSEILPGIAISVALIPPLAVVGIGLARLDWFIVSKSMILFSLNAIGIIISSMIVFSLMNFNSVRKYAKKAVVKEEKALN